MIVFMLSLLVSAATAADIQPPTFPVFLKEGFSSVLEFEEAPTKVVLGNSKSFQIERIERSLVIRPLVDEGSSNLFVYFKKEKPKILVLTVSENVEPLFYKKFESLAPAPIQAPEPISKSTRIVSSVFDRKKDYLNISVVLIAGTDGIIKPKWDAVQIISGRRKIIANKIWSERGEIQRNTSVRARFIFYRPDVPKNLKGVILSIPVEGKPTFNLEIGKS